MTKATSAESKTISVTEPTVSSVLFHSARNIRLSPNVMTSRMFSSS